MARFSVDPYLNRRFDLANYNCWHLVREVWQELTGVDLGDRTPAHITAATLRGKFDTDVPAFQELPGPVDPSLVLMTRGGAVPHVGVFIAGRILQMSPGGASYTLPHVAGAGFERLRYYR